MRFCMTGQEKSDHLIHVNVRQFFPVESLPGGKNLILNFMLR